MMKVSEKEQIAQEINISAQYFGRDINPAIIKVMVSDLEDLSATAVLEAYRRYRKDSKNRFFPIPAQIREMINPSASDEGLGKEIATRIIGGVSRYGYIGAAEAKRYIGDLGWEIVQDLGGWSYICQNLGVEMSEAHFHARVRDLAIDRVKYGKKLIAETLKALEHDPKHQTLIESRTQLLEHKQQEVNREEPTFNTPPEQVENMIGNLLNDLSKMKELKAL